MNVMNEVQTNTDKTHIDTIHIDKVKDLIVQYI